MYKRITLLLIFVALFSTLAKAQDSMIPDISYSYIQKLIDTARANYPRVKTYQNRVNIAESEIVQRKLSWLDPLIFTYLYSPNNSTTLVNPNFLNGYQVGFALNVGTLLQKPSQIKQAREELKIAQEEQQTYDQFIAVEVKNRYFTYLQKVAVLRIRTQSAIDAQGVAKQVKGKFERGEETVEEYNKALIQVADQNQAKVDAEAEVFIAKSALEELLGKKLEEIK